MSSTIRPAIGTIFDRYVEEEALPDGNKPAPSVLKPWGIVELWSITDAIGASSTFSGVATTATPMATAALPAPDAATVRWFLQPPTVQHPWSSPRQKLQPSSPLPVAMAASPPRLTSGGKARLCPVEQWFGLTATTSGAPVHRHASDIASAPTASILTGCSDTRSQATAPARGRALLQLTFTARDGDGDATTAGFTVK